MWIRRFIGIISRKIATLSSQRKAHMRWQWLVLKTNESTERSTAFVENIKSTEANTHRLLDSLFPNFDSVCLFDICEKFFFTIWFYSIRLVVKISDRSSFGRQTYSERKSNRLRSLVCIAISSHDLPVFGHFQLDVWFVHIVYAHSM